MTGVYVHNALGLVKSKCTWLLVQIALMDDFDTRDGAAKRLEQARIARGIKSGREAAARFGWSYDTYAQHENGTRGITRAADRYAKAYRVSKGWLLTGEGDPRQKNIAQVVGYIGAGAQVFPIDSDGDDGMLDEVELDFPMPEGTVAAIVRGDSMLPVFEEGDLIGYFRDASDPHAVLGRQCVVKVVDGPIYLKTVKRGSTPGLFTLSSFNARDIEDVGLEWAAPFQFRVSRFQWRKL